MKIKCEVKTTGKSVRRFDRTSALIKLKSEDKRFCISINKRQRSKSMLSKRVKNNKIHARIT